MKNCISHKGLVGGFVLFAFLVSAVTIGFTSQSSALSSQFKLESSTPEIQSSELFSISIILDSSSEPVNAVIANVTFDSSKLEFVSVENGGSDYPLTLKQKISNGKVRIVRGSVENKRLEDALVASITFKPLVGDGSTALKVSGNAAFSGRYTNPLSASKNYNISGGEEKYTEDDILVDLHDDSTKITNLDVEFNRATINLSNKEKRRAFVELGFDKNNLAITTRKYPASEAHEIDIDRTSLVPGTKYFYRIVTENKEGVLIGTKTKSFRTKGYRLRLKLLDSAGQVLRNKKVRMFSDPVTGFTDDNGEVVFEDVAPGHHTVVYAQNDKTFSENLIVDHAPVKTAVNGVQTAEPQDVDVKFASLEVDSSRNLGSLTAVLIAGVIALAVYGLLKNRLARNKVIVDESNSSDEYRQ